MKLEIINIRKSFSNKRLFDNLSLGFESGKITCILGPSGCGKTTLLNMIAGTEKWDAGDIIPKHPHHVSYLYQEARLLPWLNVLENVMYLMEGSMSKVQRQKTALQLLEEVDLSGVESLYPEELSGGMARRVALARALGRAAPLLLMDEPFVSLDSELKDQIVILVKSVLQKKTITTICVTHDLNVAETLGDTLITLGKGRNGVTIIKHTT